MSTHDLCFGQEYEKYQNFLSENFHFLVVKFSLYLNRRVFVMIWSKKSTLSGTVYSDDGGKINGYCRICRRTEKALIRLHCSYMTSGPFHVAYHLFLFKSIGTSTKRERAFELLSISSRI